MKITIRKLVIVSLAGVVLAGIGAVAARLIYPSAQWEMCKKFSETHKQKKCYASYVISVLKQRGIPAAFEESSKIFDKDPVFRIICHDMAHTIGHEAYDLFKAGKAVSPGKNSAFCGFGFYHGFMEFLISKHDSLARATSFCDDVSNHSEGDQEKSNCYHGIGHGSVIRHQKAVSVAWEKIPDGIALCEALLTIRTNVINCVDGVIDGVASEITEGLYPASQSDIENPYAICETVNEQYQPSCYPMLSWLTLYVSHHNFAEALSKNSLVKPPGDRVGVVSTLATLAPRLQLEQKDPLNLAKACYSLEGEMQTACISGLARGYTIHLGTPGREYIRGFAFCETPDITVAMKPVCVESALSAYSTLSSASRFADACMYDNGKYQKYCQKDPHI